jgi:hypothetical protein
MRIYCSSVADRGSWGEGVSGSAKDSWVICSLKNVSLCGCAVRAYSHEVRVSESMVQPYRYDKQEKEISFEVKEPSPRLHRSDNLGHETGVRSRSP